MPAFEDLKNAEFHGVKELADVAAGVLRSSGTSQDKGTVAEFPNERTVRYYLGEGLIGQPPEKRGTTSVFGYEHLLALLAIKKLQSDGLPISVIKTLIEGKTVPELEMILGEHKVDVGAADSLVFSESFEDAPAFGLHSSLNDVQFGKAEFGSAAPKKNAAKEYLESLLLGSRRQETAPLPQVPLAAAAAPLPEPRKAPATWQRHEIEPGLELHVRDDYQSPSGYRPIRKLLETIKKILQR